MYGSTRPQALSKLTTVDSLGAYNIIFVRNKDFSRPISHIILLTLIFISLLFVSTYSQPDIIIPSYPEVYNGSVDTLSYVNFPNNNDNPPIQPTEAAPTILLVRPNSRDDSIDLTIISSLLIPDITVTATLTTLEPCIGSASGKVVALPMDTQPTQDSSNMYKYRPRSDLTWNTFLVTVSRCGYVRIVITVYNDAAMTNQLNQQTFQSTDDTTAYIMPTTLLLRTYWQYNFSVENESMKLPNISENVESKVYYHGYDPSSAHMYIYLAGFAPHHFSWGGPDVAITFSHPDLPSICNTLTASIVTSRLTPDFLYVFYSIRVSYQDILNSCVNHPAMWDYDPTINPTPPDVAGWTYTATWNIPSTSTYITFLPQTPPTSLNTAGFSYNTAIVSKEWTVKNSLTGHDSRMTSLPFEIPIAGTSILLHYTISNPYTPTIYDNNNKSSIYMTCSLFFSSLSLTNDGSVIVDRRVSLSTIRYTHPIYQGMNDQYTTLLDSSEFGRGFKPDPYYDDAQREQYVLPTRVTYDSTLCYGSKEFPVVVYNRDSANQSFIQFSPTKTLSYIQFTSSLPYKANTHTISLDYVWSFNPQQHLTISFKGKYTKYNDNTIYTFDEIYVSDHLIPDLSNLGTGYISENLSIQYNDVINLIGNNIDIQHIYDIKMTVVVNETGETRSTDVPFSLCDDGYTGIECKQTIQCIDIYNMFLQCSNGNGIVLYDNKTQSCDVQCTCFDGYMGQNCSQDETCRSLYNGFNQCSNHGNVLFNSADGECESECVCHAGWKGTTCDQPIYCNDEYVSNTYINECYNHGYTFYDSGTTCDAADDIRCICEYGWEEDNCSKTYSCQLAIYDLKKQSKCQNDMVFQASAPFQNYCTAQCGCRGIEYCNNNGLSIPTYSPNNGPYVCSLSGPCQCDTDWYGKSCQQYMCNDTYTALNQCSNNGYIKFNPNNQQCDHICTCYDGWEGDNCQYTYDCSLLKISNTNTNTCISPQQTIVYYVSKSFEGYCGYDCQCINQSLDSALCHPGQGYIKGFSDGTCDTQCTCYDGYYGSRCQHDTRCSDLITSSNECQNRGTIMYNENKQQCDSICTCNNDTNNNNNTIWTGATCSQNKTCQDIATTLKCGTYGGIVLSYNDDIDDNTSNQQQTPRCDQSCTCLYGYTGTFCTQCNIKCYRGGIENQRALCLDKYDDISPCICDTQTQNAIGRYCQYMNVDTVITIRNRVLPKWLLSSLPSYVSNSSTVTSTAIASPDPKMELFMTSLIKAFHTLLGYDDDGTYTQYNTITNIKDINNSVLYNKDIHERVIIPLTAMSVGTSKCNTDTDTYIDIPSQLTFRITSRVGHSISTISKEATVVYSKWNTILSSNTLVPILNDILSKHDIDRIDSMTGCPSSNDGPDYTIEPKEPKLDDNETGNEDDDSSNNSINVNILSTLAYYSIMILCIYSLF